MFRIHCPSCRKALKVPQEWVGKRRKCPQCGSKFDVPAGLPVEAGSPAGNPATAAATGAGGQRSDKRFGSDVNDSAQGSSMPVVSVTPRATRAFRWAILGSVGGVIGLVLVLLLFLAVPQTKNRKILGAWEQISGPPGSPLDKDLTFAADGTVTADGVAGKYSFTDDSTIRTENSLLGMTQRKTYRVRFDGDGVLVLTREDGGELRYRRPRPPSSQAQAQGNIARIGSLAWLETEGQRLADVKRQGNQLVYMKEIDRLRKSLLGKKLVLELTVVTVDQEYVCVNERFGDLRIMFFEPNDPFAKRGLRLGRAISDVEAFRLKRGDKVTVEATVAEVRGTLPDTGALRGEPAASLSFTAPMTIGMAKSIREKRPAAVNNQADEMAKDKVISLSVETKRLRAQNRLLQKLNRKNWEVQPWHKEMLVPAALPPTPTDFFLTDCLVGWHYKEIVKGFVLVKDQQRDWWNGGNAGLMIPGPPAEPIVKGGGKIDSHLRIEITPPDEPVPTMRLIIRSKTKLVPGIAVKWGELPAPADARLGWEWRLALKAPGGFLSTANAKADALATVSIKQGERSRIIAWPVESRDELVLRHPPNDG